FCVHSLAQDPRSPDTLYRREHTGVYRSRNAGESWERITNGLGQGYAVGLHINPQRAGEALVATGQRPPGLDAHVYHTLDGGRSWTQVEDPALPGRYDMVPVVLFAEGGAWIATDKGQVFGADDPSGSWSLVADLPAAIHAASAGGSPSSISSGYR
ncbi:MAG: hypothetical protein U1B78_07325, partial [Dehalococcoidia bacterium]|nr:hypothetical protein [Dehalococcoidia bacterium]